MSSYRVSRRAMLTAAGGSAALLLPLLRNIEARAAGRKAPLRLLIIHHPLGATSLDNWIPAPGASATDFTLPLESAPFTPLKPQMVLVNGLNIVCATSGNTGNTGQNSCEGGMVAVMTGVPTLGYVHQQDHCAGGASIDQLLLAQSPLLGGPNTSAPTPFQCLALGADIRSFRDEVASRVMSYRPPIANPDISLARQPLYPETQPLNTYNRLFGGALPAGMRADAVLAQKLSILDFMRGDLARLNQLVPASEKDGLARHAAAIQSLEASLRAAYPDGSSGGACVAPAAPPAYTQVKGTTAPLSDSRSTLAGFDYYPPIPDCTPAPGTSCHALEDVALNQLRLIKTAFACDLLRVATFMYAPGENWVVFPSTFQGVSLPASVLSNSEAAPSALLAEDNVPEVQAWVAQIDRYYSALTAQILQEFAATPDSDGGSLLDNTVVVYVTECARSFDHDQRNVPLLVFGGKNTGVNGGTYLNISDGQLPTQSGGTGNRPFNDLWLALAPVFGVKWDRLGSDAQFSGPLPGVFAT